MISLRLCRNTLLRLTAVLVVISFLAVNPAFCQETEDSQVFISGFNAYQQRDFASAIEKMNEVLRKYPDTPLRDMALFWLSRSYFKAGNQQEAARYMSQFSKEYPDSPLKGTVEEELLSLAARYEKGEKLSAGAQPDRPTDLQAAKTALLEKERIAAKEAEEAGRAAAAAEASRLAALKLEEERVAAEKKEQERVTAAKAEEEKRVALEKAAREKAEQERIAALKAEEARQAEAARLAAAKAAEERKIAEKSATEAEAARKSAALKAQEEQATLEKAAREKAEQERIAALKAEEARQAEAARLAAAKAAEGLRIAEKSAADAEAARKAEEQRSARERVAEEKIKAERSALREKAIAQYKSIIAKYPSSAAAVTAAAKLRELGIAVALPAKAAEPEKSRENAQVLRLEVAQFAGFEFNLKAPPAAYRVAQRSSLPFEIINRGNGNDSFYLESGFPAPFNAGFAAASSPDVPINKTPAMAPGESFKGVLNLAVPAASIDGLRIIHPVKAISSFMLEATQSREVSLTASAPLLRAIIKTDKIKPLPGEKVVYRIAVLNVGSTAAEDVTFRINFPPQLEPIDHATAGFKQETKSSIIIDGLKVRSGESREFSLAFQLKEDSLAGQELSTRAELINNSLKTTAAFVSNMAYVQPQHGILVRSGSGRIVAIPGQTITVPFVVTNSGNIREKFRIASSLKGASDAIIFHDINRDGIRQASEPIITEIGPLAPKEEASVVVEFKTPKTADDGSEGSVLLSFSSEGESSSSASGLAPLVYSRPVLQMAMTGHDGRLKPGDVASLNLTITNRGSNLARVVELQSNWPEQLELVAADPANSLFSNGKIIWRFKELGAAEKRVIKVSYRVKPGTGAGTNIELKNVMTYEDQLGNSY